MPRRVVTLCCLGNHGREKQPVQARVFFHLPVAGSVDADAEDPEGWLHSPPRGAPFRGRAAEPRFWLLCHCPPPQLPAPWFSRSRDGQPGSAWLGFRTVYAAPLGAPGCSVGSPGGGPRRGGEWHPLRAEMQSALGKKEPLDGESRRPGTNHPRAREPPAVTALTHPSLSVNWREEGQPGGEPSPRVVEGTGGRRCSTFYLHSSQHRRTPHARGSGLGWTQNRGGSRFQGP